MRQSGVAISSASSVSRVTSASGCMADSPVTGTVSPMSLRSSTQPLPGSAAMTVAVAASWLTGAAMAGRP